MLDKLLAISFSLDKLEINLWDFIFLYLVIFVFTYLISKIFKTDIDITFGSYILSEKILLGVVIIYFYTQSVFLLERLAIFENGSEYIAYGLLFWVMWIMNRLLKKLYNWIANRLVTRSARQSIEQEKTRTNSEMFHFQLKQDKIEGISAHMVWENEKSLRGSALSLIVFCIVSVESFDRMSVSAFIVFFITLILPFLYYEIKNLGRLNYRIINDPSLYEVKHKKFR